MESDREELPTHILFALHEETTHDTAEYVAAAKSRLEEVVALDATDFTESERKRRAHIIAIERRRRRLAHPVLSLAVQYPKPRYQ